jgi:AcrR family transcriptional regulator
MRTEQARETRRRIVAAATESLLANGYAATTMRAVAAAAQVSVPSVEATFGTKPALLKAAIDVAIAGDDASVPVLARGWTGDAHRAPDAAGLVGVIADVVAAAQDRSAGLVLAVFEAAASAPELGALADQLTSQRAATSRWIVDALASKAPLRRGWSSEAAADTVWILMDPAVYVRLVRDRGWTSRAYRDWWARSIELLVDEGSAP